MSIPHDSRVHHPTVSRLSSIPETVFAAMTALAIKNDAVNLGQGFPDEDGPEKMLQVAANEILSGNNQYGIGRGLPSLREAIAEDRRLSHGQVFDPDTEIAVTVGATEGIAAAILGMVEPGAEVVLIEPYYDAYAAATVLAGGYHKAVSLLPDPDNPTGWALDIEGLKNTVSDATSMIIVNTPHNPTGHVFTEAELSAINDVAVEHDCLVLADEVYEHLVFSDARHIPVATVGDLAERTLTLSSVAKSFNVTGWKTGWMMGPQQMVTAAVTAKQFMTYVGVTPIQPAVEYGLRNEREWVRQLAATLERRKDVLSAALNDLGFATYHSEGSYFLITDISSVPGCQEMTGEEFCRMLPEQAGVAAIPVTAFVDNEEPYRSLVRWSFCKNDATLAEAVERLTNWVEGMGAD